MKNTQSFLFILLLLGGISMRHNTANAMLSPVDGLEAPKSFGVLCEKMKVLPVKIICLPVKIICWMLNQRIIYGIKHDDFCIVSGIIKSCIGRWPLSIVLNMQDRYGDTALHRAVRGGNIIIIQDLIAAGANPLIKNKNGTTALMEAALNPSITCWHLLDAEVNHLKAEIKEMEGD
jgi:hypothetical protein